MPAHPLAAAGVRLTRSAMRWLVCHVTGSSEPTSAYTAQANARSTPNVGSNGPAGVRSTQQEVEIPNARRTMPNEGRTAQRGVDYERSVRVQGMFSNFKSDKISAHLRKDTTRSVHASGHHSESMYSSKCCLCSWSLPADFFEDPQSLSSPTSNRPVPASGAIVHSTSGWEIEGGHFTIAQGEHSSLTININRKSCRARVRIHLIGFYYLATPTA